MPCSRFSDEKHVDVSSTTLSQESSDTTLSVTSPEMSIPKASAPDTPTQAPAVLLRSAPRRPEPLAPPELLEVPRCLPADRVEQRKVLVEMCVRALFLCLNRFPQHYKSLYRLAHLYACSKTHKVRHTHTLARSIKKGCFYWHSTVKGSALKSKKRQVLGKQYKKMRKSIFSF